MVVPFYGLENSHTPIIAYYTFGLDTTMTSIGMYVIIVNIIVKEGLGFWIVYGILKNPINI
jgi:hypothetical protein